MKFEQLEYLLTVSQIGNMRNAGGILHTSHQNISKSIKDLEEELDMALLIRTNKGISLTKNGEVVCNYAQEILRLQAEIYELSNHSKVEKTIKKKCYDVLLASAFYKIFHVYSQYFQRDNDAVCFYETCDNPTEILQKTAQQVDSYAAILTMMEMQDFLKCEDRMKETYDILILGEDRLVLAAGKQVYRNYGKTISIKELEKIELTFDKKFSKEENFYLKCLKEKGFQSNNIVEAGTTLIHYQKGRDFRAVIGTEYSVKATLPDEDLQTIPIHPKIEVVYVMLFRKDIEDMAAFYAYCKENFKLNL